MTHIQLARVELLIREAVACVQAAGWTIAPYRTVNDKDKKCCPMGAVVLTCERPGELLSTAAMRVLGFNQEDLWSFVRGFDRCRGACNGLSRLGAKFRTELLYATS